MIFYTTAPISCTAGAYEEMCRDFFYDFFITVIECVQKYI